MPVTADACQPSVTVIARRGQSHVDDVAGGDALSSVLLVRTTSRPGSSTSSRPASPAASPGRSTRTRRPIVAQAAR